MIKKWKLGDYGTARMGSTAIAAATSLTIGLLQLSFNG